MEFSIKQGSPDTLKCGCVTVGIFANGKLSKAAQILDKASKEADHAVDPAAVQRQPRERANQVVRNLLDLARIPRFAADRGPDCCSRSRDVHQNQGPGAAGNSSSVSKALQRGRRLPVWDLAALTCNRSSQRRSRCRRS